MGLVRLLALPVLIVYFVYFFKFFRCSRYRIVVKLFHYFWQLYDYDLEKLYKQNKIFVQINPIYIFFILITSFFSKNFLFKVISRVIFHF
ncbi:hypothetical protein AR462_04195 [Rickettsia prowazekii]|nr:hypothetical protein AR462_04195 [Rickettsia prowazekii]